MTDSNKRLYEESSPLRRPLTSPRLYPTLPVMHPGEPHQDLAIRQDSQQQTPQQTDESRRPQDDAAALADAERVRLEQQALLDAARIEAVARLKLPDLWRAHPAAWFMKAEALFTAHRITADQTKFSHVVAALDADTFIQLQDAIQAAPSTGKYEHLKQTVISRFADSADRSLQKLLNEMSLGADRPSQLLAKMKNLSQSRISDDVLRVRWAALLPANVQPLLKILPSTSLNELALLADRLLEGQGQVSEVQLQQPAEVCAAAPGTSLQRQLDDLRTIVTALTTQLAEQRLSRPRGRSRSRSHSRRLSRGPSPQRRNDSWCFYHNRFGQSARNCASPCTFVPQGSLNP